MGKKTNKQKLKATADKLWSEAVRKPGKCVKCGTSDNLHGHHIIEKSRCNFLRYSLDNGIPLCFKCHFWWHNMPPTVVSSWFIDKFGKERFDRLNSQQQKIITANNRFYEEAIWTLTKYLSD